MIYQIINNRKKEILYFVLLLIIFYRSPYILLHGRFMAEEGTANILQMLTNTVFIILFSLSILFLGI